MAAEVAVRHLAAHAPTPDTFAVGVATIIDDPLAAFAFSARHAQADDLAALGERYGLDPATTAQLLADAGTHPTTAVEAITIACNGDTDAAAAIAARHFNLPATLAPVIDLTTLAGLRAALPSPSDAGADDLVAQLAALTAPMVEVPSMANQNQEF